MATDVARLSYDPARGYRGVVPQQGRVSLEAEQNEQRVLDTEQRRQALLDVIGPAGTPDDGYAVSGGTGQQILVGAGTMYVGGWRLSLDSPLSDDDQPDWLDRGRDRKESGREHVMLMLTDTDVTAVEDPALYEVALGGPDSSARTKLLQRIVRLPTDSPSCAEALDGERRLWARQGLSFDPDSMALESGSRLLVGWEGDPEPANPCEPSSTGGYLGAENQLVRVQVVQAGEDGTVDLVWGYDDASSLYRVSADASADPVLTLDRTPVDDFHRPRAGQAVQALRATAELRGTDGAIEGYVAALGGQVGVLGTPYDPDTKAVRFPAPLPADYLDPDVNPQLFLRIWEELLTGVPLGKPISLTGTGMRITITADTKSGTPQVDDFWCIGVRPSTPTTVYPERYLRAPQPPDGPHRWACPLAVIEWVPEREGSRLVVLEDCRRHFVPLTDAVAGTDGCCAIEVSPSDAASGRLQELIDQVATGRTPAHRDSRVTVCFAPGRYELRAPLVLRRWHSNLTLQGCSEAAVITAHPDAVAEFGNGLVVLADADNISLTGLEFVLPQVPIALARPQASTGGLFDRAAVRGVNEAAAGRYLSIGIRAVDCAVLEVGDCLFRYSLGEHESTPEVEQGMPRAVFAAGVFLSGGSWGLQLRGSRFLHHEAAPVLDSAIIHTMIGLLHLPSAALGRWGGKSVGLGTARLPALLEDAVISDNVFDGVSTAIAVAADVGSLRIWDNVIRNVYQGITILDTSASGSTDPTGRHQVEAGSEQARDLHATLAASFLDPVLAHVQVLGATVPLPSLPGFEPAGVQHFDPDDLARLREEAAGSERAATSRLLQRLADEHPAAAGGAAAEAGTAKASRATARPGVALTDVARQSGLSTGLLAALQRLDELSRLTPAGRKLRTAISLERNTVDCTVPLDERTSWALLLVMHRDEGTVPTAIVGNNRLTSLLAPYVAAISSLAGATVTGNIVAADSTRYQSLAVANVEAPAITGNVLIGQAVLPENRPFPAPLDTWLPLNTVL